MLEVIAGKKVLKLAGLLPTADSLYHSVVHQLQLISSEFNSYERLREHLTLTQPLGLEGHLNLLAKLHQYVQRPVEVFYLSGLVRYFPLPHGHFLRRSYECTVIPNTMIVFL